MPYSSNIFDSAVQQKLSEWQFTTYLDIGAGAGKYGKLIRSMFPDSQITAVESESDYISRFDLHSIYNRVIQIDARDLIEGEQDTVYDAVILGDVIEHLPKSVGVDLVHFLIYRCRKLLVIYPSKYIQFCVDGRASESHRSVWSPPDFTAFISEHHSDSFMNFSVVDGYIGDPEAILPTTP